MSAQWFKVYHLAFFAAVLLLQLWRGHGSADADELCTESLCLPGTCAHTHTDAPISERHPVQGLPGTTHMLLHMK